MGFYGEAVLMNTLGKIPDGARKVRMPLFIEHRLGKVYHVGAVDVALLRGDYWRAYALVEEDMENYFSRLLKDAVVDGFPRCDGRTCDKEKSMILQEAVESRLKERYASSVQSREFFEFIERRRERRFVI